jgi:hypothetical protein
MAGFPKSAVSGDSIKLRTVQQITGLMRIIPAAQPTSPILGKMQQFLQPLPGWLH